MGFIHSMCSIKIIKQSSLKGNGSQSSDCIFGKEFALAPVSDNVRIVVHEDFLMITEQDISDFIAYSEKKNTIVISGCKAKVHPYRLMYIDEEGYDSHLADIPQSIRGNRQCYPEVYQFIPALISIPPKTPIRTLDPPEDINMYVMLAKKLLDKSSLIDKLLIMSLNQSSNRT